MKVPKHFFIVGTAIGTIVISMIIISISVAISVFICTNERFNGTINISDFENPIDVKEDNKKSNDNFRKVGEIKVYKQYDEIMNLLIEEQNIRNEEVNKILGKKMKIKNM